MKIELSHPVAGISGTTANSQLVFTTVGGKVYARANVKPRNPRTFEQNRIRSLRREAIEQWNELSSQARAAWEQWATAWAPVTGKAPGNGWPAGRNAFIGAAQRRLILGRLLYDGAPLPLPPPALLSAQEMGTGELTSFRFRVLAPALPAQVEAALPVTVVQVRITPATLRPARAPYTNYLRMICGLRQESFGTLDASGETVIEFTDARYAITAGQRFGFELTPVRLDDGVSGKPLWVDCIRK